MKKNKFTSISLKPSIVKLSSSYLLLVSISLFLLCLALGSALRSSFSARELISKRQNLTETNNIVYSLLIDLGHEDIFFSSEDEKFKETKNLSIYQISKILNSYTEVIKIEELTAFNELAKEFVESPIKERRKITYRLQVEAKKILSKLRDQITALTAEIESEMKKIISTVTLIISFATVFMLFSIIYNFVDRRKWNSLVAEMTAAKKSAENLSNLKSQFLATVSHEVRTPLNGIIATAEVLGTNRSLDLQAKQMCSVIQSSGNTLLRIINDILDYSKMESDNINFHFESFDLRGLIDEIIETNKHRANKKNLDLKVVYKNIKFDIISMDRDRLAQILYNVIGNAIKFTEVGEVLLVVEMMNLRKNLILKFTVRDTGLGIPDEEKDKVFAPFAQIQTQGTSGEAGTGLGLSISKKIVDKLNGQLTFISTVGVGTEFVITIPISKGTKKQMFDNSRQNLINSKSVFYNKVNNKKLQQLETTEKVIFIAEDNPTNQIVINTMLNIEKVPHVLFSNGKELLTALQTNRPRLVLMDCQMPIMDGYEATEIINKKYPHLPVVAMTADATDKNIKKCQNYGFDGIIVKPLSISSIKDLLNRYKMVADTTDLTFLSGDENIKSFNSKTSIAQAINDLDNMYGKDKRQKIIDAFKLQIINLDQELTNQLKTGNLKGLQRIGHKFKSSSQIIGAEEFAKLFERLEFSEDLNASFKLTSDILAEKQKVVDLIENII